MRPDHVCVLRTRWPTAAATAASITAGARTAPEALTTRPTAASRRTASTTGAPQNTLAHRQSKSRLTRIWRGCSQGQLGTGHGAHPLRVPLAARARRPRLQQVHHAGRRKLSHSISRRARAGTLADPGCIARSPARPARRRALTFRRRRRATAALAQSAPRLPQARA